MVATRPRMAKSLLRGAEDGAVEVHEAEQPGADSDGEDDCHRREGGAVPLLERGRDRPARMRKDVPEQEDKDAGRERVEQSLDRLG